MSDREKIGLKGLVRSISLEAPSGSRDSWLFDHAGRLLERSHHHSDGRQWTTKFRYDDLGNLLEPKPRKDVHQYTDGRRTEVEALRASDNSMWGDVPGLPCIGFPTRGASKVETSYDSQGCPVETVFYDVAGNITTRVVFKADERGNIVEAVQYSGSRPTLRSSGLSRFLLPRSDKQKYRQFLEPGGVESRSTFRYDDLGQLIESTSYMGLDNVIEHVAYSYNEHGDMLTESRERAEGGTTLVEFEYDYDARGNWTRQCAQSGGSVHEMLRTIDYYDQ